MVRATATLLLIAASLASGPAAAQFGSIFGGPPPRPPADVPNGGFPAQPPPVYPGQTPPPYAAPTYQPTYNAPPPQQPQQYPPYPSQAPYASQSPYAPPPPAGLPPSAGPPPSTIQARPLAPPPGASQAPAPTASTPPASGGRPAPQQANTSPQQGPAPQGTSPAPEQADTTPPDDTIVTEMPAAKIANGRAVFSGLDKITGRTISFDAAIGETVQFGALQVTPRVCYTRPPTEATNTDAFVQVDEVTLKGEIKQIFSGWMFAASPGLHAVEHPIYDVWLTNCAAPVSGPVAESTPPPASPTPAAPQRSRQASPRQVPRAPSPAAQAPVTDD